MKKQVVVSTLACGLCTLSTAATAKVNFDVDAMFKKGGAQIKVVSNKKLGHMRGKFIAGNKIVKFGVEMVSRWKLDNGQVLTAGSQLTINRAGGNKVRFRPVVTITEATDTHFADTSTTGVITGHGQLNASGVVQSIQIAADDSSVLQDIDMNIVSGEQFHGSDVFDDVSHGASKKVELEGATAKAFLNAGGVGVSINVPGKGTVIQALRKASGRGLLQSVRLISSGNEVQSFMRVHIGLAQSSNRQILSSTARVIQSIAQHQGI